MRTLLRGGAVLDVDAGALLRADVLIEDARIVAVGPGLAASGARVVELGGRTADARPDRLPRARLRGRDGCPIRRCSPRWSRRARRSCCSETLLRGFTTMRDMGGADAGLRRRSRRGCSQGRACLSPAVPISQTGGHGDMRNPADSCAACACGAEAT